MVDDEVHENIDLLEKLIEKLTEERNDYRQTLTWIAQADPDMHGITAKKVLDKWYEIHFDE